MNKSHVEGLFILNGYPVIYNSVMYRLFPDTHPMFEDLQIELLQRAESWQKLEMVWQMNAAVRTMLLSGLRARHPDDPAEMINRRLADLLLGEKLAEQVFGPLEADINAG